MEVLKIVVLLIITSAGTLKTSECSCVLVPAGALEWMEH